MNNDCLKLTAYFSERQRVSGRFVAEALLELYDQREVATSVMLRGVAGFGLSLSEDPPVAVAAVDTSAKIAELADDVVAMTSRGLVTLERARLLSGDVSGFTLPDHDAVKLTIYVGRQQRVARAPAHYAVCDLLFREGLASASVFLGVDGTARGQRHRAHFFSRNVDVPLMIISVGASQVVARVVPELGEMLSQPLLTVERIRVCKADGELLARPDVLPQSDDRGRPLFQKLMVYTSEATHLHRALMRDLRETASGVTVLRGMWGFSGSRKPHGDKFFQLTRQVPVTTIVVDTPERIARSFDIVDELTGRHGLVTSEMVPAVGGTDLADYRY